VTEAKTCYQGDQYLYVEARPSRSKLAAGETSCSDIMPTVERFRDEYLECGQLWRRRLDQWRSENKTVVVWGSGGKGISFLSSLPNSSLVSSVVDVNPDRQNHFIPISGQMIVDPTKLTTIRPDIVILTNALYQKEITDQLEQLGIECQILVA
jgi:hypothetical protein